LDPDDRSSEDEWFRRNEQEMLDQARRAREIREKERAARESDTALRERREAHWMKCPKCGHDMETETLSGIDVDRCTHCEGIYLDAGELETFVRQKESERRGFIRGLFRM
jgi:hypothetical protein